jgi:hypothetical protein
MRDVVIPVSVGLTPLALRLGSQELPEDRRSHSRAVQPLVQDDIYGKPKIGFGAPRTSWYRGVHCRPIEWLHS